MFLKNKPYDPLGHCEHVKIGDMTNICNMYCFQLKYWSMVIRYIFSIRSDGQEMSPKDLINWIVGKSDPSRLVRTSPSRGGGRGVYPATKQNT